MSGAHRRTSPHKIAWMPVISNTIAGALVMLSFLGVIFGPIYTMSRTDWIKVAMSMMVSTSIAFLVLIDLWDHRSYQSNWDPDAERAGKPIS